MSYIQTRTAATKQIKLLWNASTEAERCELRTFKPMTLQQAKQLDRGIRGQR